MDFFIKNRKILELEEELKVVGNNMKSLELSEQEASDGGDDDDDDADYDDDDDDDVTQDATRVKL